jgi:hypothetical protein
MRAAVSVIVPTLDAAEGLPRCLAALFEGLEAGLIRELVISDGGSDDDTLAIAAEAGARVVTGAPSRGGQLRRGGDVAAGEWLLFLHADTVLAAGWAEVVARHIRAGDFSMAGYFRLEFDAPGIAPRMVARWANLRSRLFGLPFGDQGLLISRELYDRVGGYVDIPLMEDVALVRQLRGRLVMLCAGARTSAAKYETTGYFRRGVRNWLCLMRYFAGADPAEILRTYRR